MTPFEIAIVFGAIAGWASFGYLIYKSRMDRPKLTFEEGTKIFYPNERGNNFTPIVIRMKVHNKGTKPTTIHHTKLSFDYNSEHHELENDIRCAISPNSTVDYSPSMHLHKDDLIIIGQITNCVLIVKHTHGKTKFKLGTIEGHIKTL